MRRTLCVVVVLVALVSALPVVAADAPLLRADPIRAQVELGSQYRGFLTVTSTNDFAETFALSVNAGGLPVSLDASSVDLGPRETRRVGFLLQAPSSGAPGDVLVRFDASGSGVSAQAYHQVRVLPRSEGPFDAGAMPATNVGDIGAAITDGGVFDADISVRNQNLTTVKTFEVRAVAPPGWIMTVDAEQLTIGLNETALLHVHAAPTASAQNGTGRVEIGPKWAHTAVQVSLNVTHLNRTDFPVMLRIGGDRLDAIVDEAKVERVNITVWNDGETFWSGEVEVTHPDFLVVYGDRSFVLPPGGSSTRQYNLTVRQGSQPGSGTLEFRVPGGVWTVQIEPPLERPPPALTIEGEATNVPFLSNAVAQVIVRDNSGLGWSGEVRATVVGPFSLPTPVQPVDVPPGGAVTLAFMVSAGAGAPGDVGEVQFEAGGIVATRALRITGQLRLAGDLTEVVLRPGESRSVNLTLWNDAAYPVRGSVVNLTLPPGVTVSGDLRFDVAPESSLTRELVLTADDPAPPGAGGEVLLGIHRQLLWSVQVEVDGAPGVLRVRLDRESIALDVGASTTVNVTIENGRDAPWDGLLQRDPSASLDATLVPDALYLAPGERRTFEITITALAAQDGEVRFYADDANATLRVAARAPETPIDVGGGSLDPRVVALATIGGVAVVAGAASAAPKRWPLAFAGLYARLAGSRLLEHPVRRRIRALVETAPGITYNEIGRQLDLDRGVLDHHLHKLTASGLVSSVPDGQYRRFYAPGSSHPVVRGALDTRILAIVRERGETRAADVAATLGVSRQAMHYHLRRMVREGSIVANRGTDGLVLRASA